MGRKKNLENKTNIESLQEKLEAARRMRLNMAKRQQQDEKDDYRQQFSDYWSVERKKYNKDKDLEGILWLHLKSIKHDKPSLFEKGIKHFGLKKVRE